ncbi:hypothetical protein ACRALDRAFT_207821 [Sodiomyces alcalophilus JCM 7366]|uniref:uncharacterized protein n=1 Tax=Sodiomyces alcalophilus JCM 7366 TaxID=591952 RepID=UPI0039B4E353
MPSFSSMRRPCHPILLRPTPRSMRAEPFLLVFPHPSRVGDITFLITRSYIYGTERALEGEVVSMGPGLFLRSFSNRNSSADLHQVGGSRWQSHSVQKPLLIDFRLREEREVPAEKRRNMVDYSSSRALSSLGQSCAPHPPTLTDI